MLPLLGALAPSIFKGISSIFGNKSQNNANKQQIAANNAYTTAADKAKQGIFSGLQAAGYNPYGPQTSISTGLSNQFGTQDSTTNTDMHTAAETAGINQPMEGKLRGLLEGRLGYRALPPGYAENALRAINRTYDTATNSALGSAAAKGFGALQRGAAVSPIAGQRAGQIADLLGSLPMKQLDLQRQAEGDVSKFLAERQGTHQTGTSRTHGTSQSQGSSTQQNTSGPNIDDLLKLLMPTAPQQVAPGYSTVANIAGAASPVAGALAQWYASRPGQV